MLYKEFFGIPQSVRGQYMGSLVYFFQEALEGQAVRFPSGLRHIKLVTFPII